MLHWRHSESKAFYPRTQHKVPGQASNPTGLSRDKRSNYEATMPPCFNKLMSSVGILTIKDILKYLLINVFGW